MGTKRDIKMKEAFFIFLKGFQIENKTKITNISFKSYSFIYFDIIKHQQLRIGWTFLSVIQMRWKHVVLRINWYCACSEISSYSCMSFSYLMEIHLKLCHVLFLLRVIKPASEKSDQQLVQKKNRREWVSKTFPREAGNCWESPPLRGTHRLTWKSCLFLIGI